MKLINVSNRLPFELKKVDGKYTTVKTVGGLATAVEGMLKKRGGIWIGWAGNKESEYAACRSEIESWQADNYFGLSIPDRLLDKFYSGFVNNFMWPLFHNFHTYAEFELWEWLAFVEVNNVFADAVLDHYENGDTVWIHDFQLMLLPKMLRMRVPDIKIGFFLHISFPSPSVFELAPHGDEILSAVLDADYISFHTSKYAENFTASCRQIGLEPKNLQVGVDPIGIDCRFFEQALENPAVQEKAKALKDSLNGKKLIIATERLDYTKGIKERLKAFEYLLDNHPELRGQVVLLQIAVHSRLAISLYQRMAAEINELVERINGKYATFDWTPILYHNNGLSQEDLAGLYSIADVACVTPLVDGMNLVCKEFITCTESGKLILSKFAGAAEELTEAYIVNPYNTVEVAQALYWGLASLGHQDLQALKGKVYGNQSFDWAEKFIENLYRACRI